MLRKHELLERQKAARASREGAIRSAVSTIGWHAQGAARRAQRVYQSPGPIYEPEGTASDYWRLARAMHAAGLRAGYLAHNCFSYHLTPGGLMMESGALALGCSVFPGGVGDAGAVRRSPAPANADLIGTPKLLKILVEKAAESGVAIDSISKALLGGEAFTDAPARSAHRARHPRLPGLLQRPTSASSPTRPQPREGLVLDEGVIVEIVRPGSGDPVADGRGRRGRRDHASTPTTR